MKFFRLLTFVVLGLALPLQAADESTALAVLASAEADLHAKAMACDELGRVGTAKAVPVLAELLHDRKLHDYARDGLERIKDPAAGKALFEAFIRPKERLTDSQLIGVIISLGDRREVAAVPALSIINGDIAAAKEAALNSLAKIANDAAGKAILETLAKGPADFKIPAAHAALAAAQRMEKDGRSESAGKLRKAVAAADVPAHLKKAAGE